MKLTNYKRNLGTDLGDKLLTVVHVDAPIKSATLGRAEKQKSIPEDGRSPVKVGGHRFAAREDTARRHDRAALVAAGRLLRLRLLTRRQLLMTGVLTAVRTDQELAIVVAGRYLQVQWMMLPGHSHIASRFYTRARAREIRHAHTWRIIINSLAHQVVTLDRTVPVLALARDHGFCAARFCA